MRGNISSVFRMISALSVCFLFALARDARACGGPPPVFPPWTLDHLEYSEDYPAKNELPFLSPGNDTRTNLQLLMMESSPWRVDAVDTLKLEKSFVGFDEKTQQPKFGLVLNLFEPALFTLKELGDDFCKGKKDHRVRTNPELDDEARPYDQEGSRCDSFKGASAAFDTAVTGEKNLSDAEKKTLHEARASMTFKCDDPSSRDAPAESFFPGAKPTPLAREFGVYLSGAKAFYEGSFDHALEQFGTLSGSNNPWLRETADYMVARTLLNKAQVGAFAELDGAPRPKIKDVDALKRSDAQFRSYLSRHPEGIYANSARGLLRRIHWLSGDDRTLSKDYAVQISRLGDKSNPVNSIDLAQEIDNKLLDHADAPIDDPVLDAVNLLRQMRASGDARPVLTEKQLLEHEHKFANSPALFNFLRAARAYYVDRNLEETARFLGQARDPIAPGYVNFSNEVLRGQMLMASGKMKEAEEQWLRLLPVMNMPWQRQAIELGLAMTWERMGLVSRILDNGGGIASPKIRSIILRYVSGPILLRQAIFDPRSTDQEKALARFTLWFKEATRGQYANFLKDFAPEDATGVILSPSGEMKLSAFLWSGSRSPYDCPALKNTVEELSRDPESAHGQICLAEFVRLADLDPLESVSPKSGELGGGKDIFPGPIYSRGEIYKKLIAKGSLANDDKAYALYRAIYCYSPTGINGCGGQDVPKDQRKKWFGLLKSKFGATPWAREIKYFW
jgi:hypothetical protein